MVSKYFDCYKGHEEYNEQSLIDATNGGPMSFNERITHTRFFFQHDPVFLGMSSLFANAMITICRETPQRKNDKKPN